MTCTSEVFAEAFDYLFKDQSRKDYADKSAAKAGRTIGIAAREHLEDLGMVRMAIQQDPWALQFAPDELRQDEDLCLSVLRGDYRSFRFAHPDLRGSREYMEKAIAVDGRALRYAEGDEVKNDMELIRLSLKQDGTMLEFLDEQYRENRGVTMSACAASGHALQHASEALRGDKRVAAMAVSHAPSALKSCSEELQNDRELWLQCVGERNDLWSTKKTVLDKVDREGRLIRYASERLRGDRETVMRAATQNPTALEFAPEKLRGRRTYMLECAQKERRTLEYATDEIRNDRSLFLELLPEDGLALEFASEALRDDEEIVRIALIENGSALRFASERLRGDRELVLLAMRRDRTALAYGSEELRNDEDIWLYDGDPPVNNAAALRERLQAVFLPADLVEELIATAPKEKVTNEGDGEIETLEDLRRKEREVVEAVAFNEAERQRQAEEVERNRLAAEALKAEAEQKIALRRSSMSKEDPDLEAVSPTGAAAEPAAAVADGAAEGAGEGAGEAEAEGDVEADIDRTRLQLPKVSDASEPASPPGGDGDADHAD